MPPVPITRLRDIAADYDALLCDAWGVIHDGRRVFDGVADALTGFRRARGPVVILTNAPKPSMLIPGQLDRLGLPRDAYDGVVTSGDATRAEIARRLPAPAYRIGWESDIALYEGMAIDFVPLSEASFIVCTGLAENGPATPEGYRGMLVEAAARGAPMICANPDLVVRWNGRLEWCAGAIAAVYESLGGPVVYAGKPHPAIYDRAFEALAEAAGTVVARPRALAIGDGPGTDILGANRYGVDALLISGEGGVHAGDGGPAAIEAALAAAGAEARFVMEGLAW